MAVLQFDQLKVTLLPLVVELLAGLVKTAGQLPGGGPLVNAVKLKSWLAHPALVRVQRRTQTVEPSVGRPLTVALVEVPWFWLRMLLLPWLVPT